MSKILIIEDDTLLNDGLCYNFEKAGIGAFPVYTLEEARERIKRDSLDLILIDVNLPDGDGFTFAREELASQGMPFVFLTAHNLDQEVLDGFQMGADDYITKPFNVKIVVERIRAVLRRYSEEQKRVYRCGNLQIDFDQRIVCKNGQPVALTPTEMDILQYLFEHKKQILTKEILLENIWDYKGSYVNEHTLTMNISRLRAKIEDDEYTYIQTIYGMGYKWTGEKHEKDQ